MRLDNPPRGQRDQKIFMGLLFNVLVIRCCHPLARYRCRVCHVLAGTGGFVDDDDGAITAAGVVHVIFGATT